MATPEARYKDYVIDLLLKRFPGAVPLKLDPAYMQGIPDWLVLYNKRWGMLELKASRTAHKQPNQEFYVDYFNNMSFASFISPETTEEVIDALQRSFGITG